MGSDFFTVLYSSFLKSVHWIKTENKNNNTI